MKTSIVVTFVPHTTHQKAFVQGEKRKRIETFIASFPV